MILRQVRKYFTEISTISELFVNDVFECYILEDKVRDIKINGITAIPYGEYKIIITKSDRFSKMAGHDVYLPLLLNVPNFQGVRIHSGNKPEDTEGCLLPGTIKGKDSVANSRTAFIKLNEKINQALKKGEDVIIKIEK